MNAFQQQLSSGLKMAREKRNFSLVDKIEFCITVFDFKQVDKKGAVADARNLKRTFLLDLIAALETSEKQDLLANLDAAIEMIRVNLFRTPKVQITAQQGSTDDFLDAKQNVVEEVIMLEEQWPHLQIVYELLLRIIICKDVDQKQLTSLIDHFFLMKLFELFKTPDPMERDYLKTVVHRFYSRFMTSRGLMRKLIVRTLVVGLYDDQ